MLRLKPGQLDAVKELRTGKILCGSTGSGKSITALAYYYICNGGSWSFLKGGEYVPMDDVGIKDLYIITTAQKRDKAEWSMEMARFLLSPHEETNLYTNKVVVDSWNNIDKYKNVKNAFFIFDEQRVVGYGKWSKTFCFHIAKNNDWILLSATPGDTYGDYVSIFIANGYFKNKTEFNNMHVVFNPHSKFPQVLRYIYTDELDAYINDLLINMVVERRTHRNHLYITTNYDKELVNRVSKELINPDIDEPFKSASEYCYWVRKQLNSHPSRIEAVRKLLLDRDIDRAIIFYNFDYELEALRTLASDNYILTEWNGHKHMPISKEKRWLHLVQYNAGAEGWNCIETDTLIFYSENYSYKMMEQAAGRIDRLNTRYTELWYYHFRTSALLDNKIRQAIRMKKKFNEQYFKYLFNSSTR